MSETYTTGGDTTQRVDGGERAAQTFTPLETHVLAYVDLQMMRWGFPDTVIIEIYQTDGAGKPTGTPISFSTGMVWPTKAITYWGRQRFEMTPVTLNVGVTYAIVSRPTPTTPPLTHFLEYDAGDATYPRGQRLFSADDGLTWTPHPGDDHIFAEFGSPPAPTPPPPPPVENFAVVDLTKAHYENAVVLTLSTNVPCHLTCYWTDTEARRHKATRTLRGLNIPWGAYYCFVGWQIVDQLEPGDTLYHTFPLLPWVYCQLRWFTFRGNVDDIASPSVGPIFKHHHEGVPTLTEEQTVNRVGLAVLTNGGIIRAGQKLTITNRRVSKLALGAINCVGFPTGDVTFTIRKVSDDSIIASKLFGDASIIWAGAGYSPPQLHEVTFDTPVVVNEEVRILLEHSDGDMSNYIAVGGDNVDLKADENFTRYIIDYSQDIPSADACYRYTYTPYYA